MIRHPASVRIPPVGWTPRPSELAVGSGWAVTTIPQSIVVGTAHPTRIQAVELGHHSKGAGDEKALVGGGHGDREWPFVRMPLLSTHESVCERGR